MTFNFRYPQITGATEKEQLSQVRSYMHQLVDELNWALNSIESPQSNYVVVQQKVNSSGGINLGQNGEAVADFVVEQSNIGNWYCRVWHSGYAECWYKRNVDVNVETEWGTALYVGQVSAIEYPFTFADIPSCQITCECGDDSISLLAASGSSSKKNSPTVMLCRTDAQLVNVNIQYYVHGRWK